MIKSRNLLSILLPIFACFSLYSQQISEKKLSDTLHLTVFVHGSIHCHLMMLSPRAVWQDSFEQDAWYLKMLAAVRQNPLLWQSRFMLGMGPQEVSAEAIERFHNRKLSAEESKIAAYHIVATYDALARHLSAEDHDRAYYLYGHLGLLSQSYRKSVGLELYEWLTEIIAQHKTQYKHIHIDIVAHSHGGNIALWLGEFEDQYKRGLFVDNLVMYATPIQVETFRFAYKPAFGRVYNQHSDGDHIQGLDRMSTMRGKSYKTFSSPHLPVHHRKSHVFDVRVLVNDKRKQIGHANMFLMDVSYPAIRALQPAPLVVMTPAFLSVCNGLDTNSLDCNFVDTSHALFVQLKNDEGVVIESCNLADLTSQLGHLLQYNWCPDYPARLRSQPARLGRITVDAVKELWRGGAMKNADMPRLIAKL